MNSLEIGLELDRIADLITTKSSTLSELREAYHTAKANYENTFSRYLLETKAKNPDWTTQEVKALAINLSYNDKLEAIKKESAYMKVVNELKALDMIFEGLKEQSYNYRQEVKKFQ